MSIFKAYDIRGVYPEELNEKIAYEIGRAFVEFLNIRNVVIGRDVRLSSDSLFKALSSGITDQGANVIEIGLSTTPMLYFAIANYNHEAGIMITASHNPPRYNGFKLCREQAIPISGTTGIKKIERLVKEDNFKKTTKGRIIKKDITNDYINHLLNFAEAIPKLKIVVDTANAMAGLNVPLVLKRLNCDFVHLFSELDGNFPNHEANPLKKENLVYLQKKIIEEKANLGVAFDGDADRVAFVDENGDLIPGDFTTALIATQILKKGKQKIMYDVRSSRVVKEEILKNKGIPVVSRIGHAFIKEKMRKEDVFFAGELSGHYYFKENFYFESSIIALLRILNLMKTENKKISEIVLPLKRYCQSGEINSNVKDKEAKIKEVEHHYKDGKINYIDGLTVEYSDWWFNLRPSNTEPLLRLNLEAKTKELMEEKKDELLELIRG